MAFDIRDVLGTVSKSNPGQEQIIYIAIDKLDPDPQNFYTLEGIEELADNISLIGLQQPLRIRPGKDGHFIVVSGHRRRAAILLISHGDTENAHMFDNGVPCILDEDECSPAMRELRLIYANSATRVMTPAEVSKQAERIEAILYQLSEEGVEFKGRMRDHVAKACAVSKSKIARLHAIRNNLVPELLEEFDANRINESVAYRISQEKPKVQKDLVTRIGLPSVRYLDINAAERRIAEVKNPTPAQKPQFDGNRYLREGREYLEKLQQEDDRFFEMLSAVQDLFFKGMDCLTSRQEGIARLKENHGRSHHGGYQFDVDYESSLKGLELGTDACHGIMRTWTDVYDMLCTIAMNEMDSRVKEKGRKKVSEQNTGPKWSTGEPKEIGDYVVVYGISKEETESTSSMKIMRWNGLDFVNAKSNVAQLEGMNIYRWLRLPEA